MADDRNENRVDLNLYLGIPRSPRVQISDLGSDLALNSLPRSPRMSNSSSIDMPYSPSHAIYTPESNIPPPHENPIQVQEEEPLLPIAPSYILLDPEVAYEDEGPSAPHFRPYEPSSYMPRSPSYSPPPLPSFANRQDESSSRRQLYDSPEFRFRRLIESDRRLRPRRYPTSPHNARSFSPDQQLVDDLMSSELNLESNGKHKINPEVTGAESSDDDKEDQTKNAADFECNICFDLAQQPVVTSCGHLFCWPCLYQWLNVHSDHKECPVCKGEVTEANITPIYGRGSSEISEEKTHGESGESNVKIPPRPRGNRFESLRQQFRPISRRFGEGISASWARLMQQAMHSRNDFDGIADPNMVNSSTSARAVLTRQTRQRTRRILRGLIADNAPQTGEHNNSSNLVETSNAGLLFDDGLLSGAIQNSNNDAVDLWSRDGLLLPRISNVHSTNIFVNEGHRAELLQSVSAYSLLARDDIRRIVGSNSRNGAAFSPASAAFSPASAAFSPASAAFSSVNAAIPVLSATAAAATTDQVSVSSTAAIIQGDVGIQAEPNSVGSSRPYRRRERSSGSGSFDVDEVLHPSKRRRFN